MRLFRDSATGRVAGPAAAASLVFAAAIADVGSRFEALPAPAAWAVFALAAVGTTFAIRWRVRLGRRHAGALIALFTGAALAFCLRAALVRDQPEAEERAERAAERVETWLADLTRSVGDAAYLLARAPNIAAAVEGSDAADHAGVAFELLGRWQLPATPIGVSGASLYDHRLVPAAWTPRSPALEAVLGRSFPDGVRRESCPDPEFPLFLYAEEGRRGYLVAAECLRNYLGLVTVAAPITETSPPASGAPPRSALEMAAGRGLTAQILSEGEAAEALEALFEREGDRFLDDAGGGSRFFFALRAYDGQLLGAASTAPSGGVPAEAERRAEAAAPAGLLLLVAAIAAVWFWRGGPLASTLAGIWLLLYAASVFLHTLPPGFRPDALLAPSGAPPLPLPWLPHSALDALLVGITVLASARALHYRTRFIPRRIRHVGRFPAADAVRGAGAGVALAASVAVVAGVGREGAVALSPTWNPGTGFAEILTWTALLLLFGAFFLLAALLIRPTGTSLLGGVAGVGAAVLVFGGGVIPFAIPPLLVVWFLRGRRHAAIALRRVRQHSLSHEPGFAFSLAFLFLAVPPILMYPALAWREGEARERYAATVAPTLARDHRMLVCHAIEEAARALAERVPTLERVTADSAWRLWRGTGLARLAPASSLEIRGPGGTVSRFLVGFPRRPAPPGSEPAPPEWEGGTGVRCEDSDPTFSLRRRFAPGLDVTLRVRTSLDGVSFLADGGTITDHLRLRGSAVPPVFAGRGLRLLPAAESAERAGPGSRRTFAVEAGGEPYVVSYRPTRPSDHAAGVLGWILLAATASLILALGIRIARLVPTRRAPARRRSFQMQLTEGLALAVLVAVAGIASFAGIGLTALLLAQADADALGRALTGERIARELGALDSRIPIPELQARLAHAADQMDTDLALYSATGLLAASRPEMAQTGVLPRRTPPDALRALSDASGDPRLAWREVGPTRYRIAWIPVPGERLADRPGTLFAVPLPASGGRRMEAIRALQRTILLGSGSAALLFAVLLPGLVARRLASPVRGLARATGRILDGDRDAHVPSHAEVSEFRLLSVNVERLARRLPRTREKIREEAAADLARRVAHDIKNPLAPIRLAADYILQVLRDPRDRDPRKAVEESVNDIIGQVERLRRISSEFSAVGAPLQRAETDVVALVGEIVAPHRRSGAGPTVSFRTGTVPTIFADAGLLQRVVENLLLNAIEAVEDQSADGKGGGSIEARVGMKDDRVVIEIEDDGPGIPEANRARVFDAAFSTRTRGSGLGLANARRFVEAHGGRIHAEARRDGRSGLLMVVELPIHPDGADVSDPGAAALR